MDIVLKDLKERLKYLETNPYQWSHQTPETLRQDIKSMKEHLEIKEKQLKEMEDRIAKEKQQLEEAIAILTKFQKGKR